MSIAIYASDAEVQQFLRYVEKLEIIQNRKNIGMHVVYKDGVRCFVLSLLILKLLVVSLAIRTFNFGVSQINFFKRCQ